VTRKPRGGARQDQRTQAPPPDSALDPAQGPRQSALLVMTRDDGLRHHPIASERNCCVTREGSSSPRPSWSRPVLASAKGRALLMFDTSLPGAFAIGDIQSGSMRRITSVADPGASVAAMVHEYQASLRHEQDAAGG
jgi:hypothetical protein